ncbi:Malic enzyme [Aphelenchoides fujianensis]|nr:Malic enzyme [Aphelenchoides fujianensis]
MLRGIQVVARGGPKAIGGRRNVHFSAPLAAKEWDLADPEQMELYKLYRPERLTPHKRGVELLKTPGLNKGMAFTLYERQYLGIHGLLPPAFMTEKQQAYRVITKLRQQPNDLARYIQLDGLQDRNEKLFYRVLVENIKELMPIVYTPTVGLACQHFGFIYRQGLYITINDNSISKIFQILSNWPHDDVRAIVVTDGERILGLGDLGAYGIGIPVGKLALYVALAGVQPRWCLPVLLDVGTDNVELLKDPFYIGLRKKRTRGEQYDNFLGQLHEGVCQEVYGQNTLIQYEDFGNQNAYRLLDRFQDKYCMFNDDIQGTAAVVVAGLMGASKASKQPLTEMTYVFPRGGIRRHGHRRDVGQADGGGGPEGGQRGESEGMSYKDACGRIYLVDIDGLVTTSRKQQQRGHAPFAKDMPEMKDLTEVVHAVKPNALIGVSTVARAFTEEIVKTMAAAHEQPIIFPLSNPTSKAECTADDAFKWTNGKVLFASGSPFANVELNGRLFKPGQGNNAYVGLSSYKCLDHKLLSFPGVALGIILFQINHVDSRHFLIAAKVVADHVQQSDLNFGRIYPRLNRIREISIQIAVQIAEECYRRLRRHGELLSRAPKKKFGGKGDKEMFIRSNVYNVEYDELINKVYQWPERDMKHGFPTPVVRRDSMDE